MGQRTDKAESNKTAIEFKHTRGSEKSLLMFQMSLFLSANCMFYIFSYFNEEVLKDIKATFRYAQIEDEGFVCILTSSEKRQLLKSERAFQSAVIVEYFEAGEVLLLLFIESIGCYERGHVSQLYPPVSHR